MATNRKQEHAEYFANKILELRKSKEKALDQINQVIQKCNDMEDGLEKTKRLEMAQLVKGNIEVHVK
jgi:hypothetical protein